MAEQMDTLIVCICRCLQVMCVFSRYKVKTAFDYEVILSQCISRHDSLFEFQPNLSKHLSWLLQDASRNVKWSFWLACELSVTEDVDISKLEVQSGMENSMQKYTRYNKLWKHPKPSLMTTTQQTHLLTLVFCPDSVLCCLSQSACNPQVLCCMCPQACSMPSCMLDHGYKLTEEANVRTIASTIELESISVVVWKVTVFFR